MFTGIITDIGTIVSASQEGDLRLTIGCAYPAESLALGESIACSGVCLTVVELVPNSKLHTPHSYFTVTLSSETLARTAPGMWEEGKQINLERALKVGDSLSGHFVTGHVDGIATIGAIEQIGDSWRMEIVPPMELIKYIAEKGSVTLDGVSLTVNNLNPKGFSVNVIPHTLSATTLGQKRADDALNLEIDVLARYIARQLAKD